MNMTYTQFLFSSSLGCSSDHRDVFDQSLCCS